MVVVSAKGLLALEDENIAVVIVLVLMHEAEHNDIEAVVVQV